jgi:hypothetical protein
MGQAALAELDPAALGADLDLAPGQCVGVARRHGPHRQSGRERRAGDRHHALEVASGHRRARGAPHVELMRLAHVQPVDDVAAVDDAGAGHERIVRAQLGELAQRARDDRRHVRSQHGARRDVAGVPGLARDAVGRVAQRVVVVGDRDDAAAAPHVDVRAPGPGQRGDRRLDEPLHAVLARVGVGQVAQRQRALELGVGDAMKHGVLSLRQR